MRALRNRFINLKFRKKLLLSYILIALIPILTLGVYLYFQTKSFLVEEEERNLSGNVDKLAENFEYKINRFNSVMEYITYNQRLVDIFNTDYTDLYLQYKDVTDFIVPTVATIRGLDDGIKEIAVCTNNDFPELIGSIKNLDKAREDFWTQYPLRNSETNWYIHSGDIVGLRRLMQQYKSPIENILYIRLDGARIFKDMELQEVPQYSIVLTDRNGQAIFEKNAPAEMASAQTLADTQNENIAVIKDSSQKEFLQLKRDLPSTKWTMLVLIPMDSIAVDAGKIVVAASLVTGGCVFLLVLAIWMFTGGFFKRINGLHEKMKIVSDGNLAIGISSDATDEIGDLTNGMGEMVRNINLLIKEIYDRSIIQKTLEIQVLQSQINPHFLYNTLSFVNWRAINLHEYEISRIMTNLSKYYRSMMNNSSRRLSVETEIENVKAYLEIQLLVHDKSFTVEYDIASEILGCEIIGFILQPLVENSIEHGVDLREEGGGLIRLAAYSDDGALRLIIEDNGPGINENTAAVVMSSESAGYGLRNVNERIKLTYGEEYGLSIERLNPCGTKVTITIPIAEWKSQYDAE